MNYAVSYTTLTFHYTAGVKEVEGNGHSSG